MPSPGRQRTALVTGANGCIGNAVARAFVRAGWHTYGLIRSPSGANSLAAEEILPVVGSIDEVSSHTKLFSQLPPVLDVVVSTTEDLSHYVSHYKNIVNVLRALSTRSLDLGTKSIVIFTSGCKERQPYQTAGICRAAVALRAAYSARIFENKDVFAPVLVRPTNVHGRSSSFYGAFFDVARAARDDEKPLLLPSPCDSICHCLQVDDCGDAYVAIASHPRRADVEDQVFNISARRFETVEDLGKALVAEYGIRKGMEFRELESVEPHANPWPPLLIDSPQWTGSEKLRRVTGWQDCRPLFTEATHTFRMAYEASQEAGHEGVYKTATKAKLLGGSVQNQVGLARDGK